MSPSTFGLFLKETRRNCNLTQTQVSQHLKISRSTYSKYEQGLYYPNLDIIADLSSIFNVNFFIFLSDNVIPEQGGSTANEKK